MKFTNEHIQQLLIEKITGTIQSDDDLVIEQLLKENKEVRLQWEAIQKQVQDAKLQGFSLETNVDESWQQIQPLMVQPQKAAVFSLAKIVAAASILAVIVLGAYLFNEIQASLLVTAKLSVEQKRNLMYLALDNGETIFLKSMDNNRFQLGLATIQTKHGELTYTYPESEKEKWGTLSVPAIANYKIKLADGTEVWMNSQTKLRFPFSFSGKLREVFIEGEAYFKVASNVNQPFIVHAHETAIKVLGTQFNVNTYDHNKIKTALVKGAIAATSLHSRVNINPGFAATYNPLSMGFNVEAFDQSEVLSWMKGVYFFHNNSLKDLSKLLSRWYNVDVIFENPSLENKTFSGEIVKNQPIQLFLDNIRISNQINLDLRDGVVYFR